MTGIEEALAGLLALDCILTVWGFRRAHKRYVHRTVARTLSVEELTEMKEARRNGRT